MEVNRVLDELVASFGAVREEILTAMTSKPVASSVASQKSQSIEVGSSSQNTRTMETRAQARATSVLVACPVCSKEIPQATVQDHVELCLMRDFKTDQRPKEVSRPKKLNKPVYNLLKESDIKKMLADLHLPNTGDREV